MRRRGAWIRPDDPLVCGHRGQAKDAPEQTLEAYRRAVELGADMIEVDARLTRDGELVLFHDATLDRTTSGHGKVSDHLWADLRLLDAGEWFAPAFAGARIPLAADAIDFARAVGVLICLEVKGGSDAEANATAEALARLIAGLGALRFAFMSSFHLEALQVARRTEPQLMLAPWMPEDRPADPDEHIRQARALGAPVITHTASLLTNDIIEVIHRAGIAIWAWTTTDAPSLDATSRLAVDGVTGDDVRAIRAACDRRAGEAPQA